MGSHLWALVLIFGAKQAKYFRTNLLGVPFRPYPISQPTAREAAASERATTMAAAIYLASSKPSSSPPFLPLPRRPSSSPPSSTLLLPGRGDRRGTVAALLAGGVAALAVAASAQALPVGAPATDAFASLQEPENALSLPTWAIHVSSVIEWYDFPQIPFCSSSLLIVICNIFSWKGHCDGIGVGIRGEIRAPDLERSLLGNGELTILVFCLHCSWKIDDFLPFSCSLK